MPYYLDYALLLTLPYYLPPSVIIRTLPQYILLTRKKNIILNSVTLYTFLLEPSQANSESGSGQQQAHSSFTAALHKHVVGQQPL
jgi:hypothetical protein